MPEIVYVLTNPAMKGLVKIGRTTDLEQHVKDLSSQTGVPVAFECFFAAEVQDATTLERKLHQLFSENRINKRREFFELDPERVALAISIGDFKEVTTSTAPVGDKEEQDAFTKVKARRSRIRLSALGLKPGDVLTFSRDERVTATVLEDGKVCYAGEPMSPSAAALRVLQSLGYRTVAASGSEHWMFDGELLDERRRRMEQQFEDAPATLPE